MEGLRVINVLLWSRNWGWGFFSCPLNSPLPFDSSVNYLGCVEFGQSPYKIVVRLNYIVQGLIFISALLCCLLVLYSVSSSSVLLCSSQHVDLPLRTSNQSYDVTHVCRIHGDTMPFPFEVVKYDVIEVDPLLKGYNVLMLDVQILASFASVCPDKELVYP